jgi:hypothetical protein
MELGGKEHTIICFLMAAFMSTRDLPARSAMTSAERLVGRDDDDNESKLVSWGWKDRTSEISSALLRPCSSSV